MKKKPLGVCAICCDNKQLTAEHIPPKKVFNNGKTYKYDLLENIGTNQHYWDKTNVRYEISQNGLKLYTLCESCNNNTGSWYGTSYEEFVKQFTPLLTVHKGNANEIFKGKVSDIFPLRIIKQILSMFCSVNYSDKGLDTLRKFVFNKDIFHELENFRLYMYLNCSDEFKLIPFQTKLHHNIDISKIYSAETMSEIATYPLGYVLYLNQNDSFRDDLVDITDFANCAYNDKCDVELTIPIKERWSPYVGDFRSKEEIAKIKEEQNNG